jgi:hypothetical protein
MKREHGLDLDQVFPLPVPFGAVRNVITSNMTKVQRNVQAYRGDNPQVLDRAAASYAQAADVIEMFGLHEVPAAYVYWARDLMRKLAMARG